MAEGLLGSISEDDKMLGLLGIGLGMLANARGRNSREAFQNSLGGAAEGGMQALGPIMQAQNARAMREMQAKQFGLQERSVGAQEELNKMHAKLYGAQVSDLERTQELLKRALGGMGGIPSGPTMAAGPDGTQLGTPGVAPPIQSRGLNEPAPTAGAPQSGGAFGISPDLVKALAVAKPQMAGPFMEMYKQDQPNIDFVGGIAVDKKTGKPVQGVPTLPQMSQPGLGYQNIPDPTSPTGFRIVSPPGALDLLAAQKGTAAGAEAAAQAPFGTPRTVKMPDGREVMMTPDQFTQFARGGAPAPLPGTPSPRSRTDITGAPVPAGMPSVEPPRPGTPEWDAFDKVRRATGPATANVPGMPGVVTGKTTQQEIDEARQKTGAVNEAELGQKRIADLQKEAQGQQGILNTIGTIEDQLKKPVLGPGPLDRGRMLLHNIGVQDQASINTTTIRALGEQLVLARGSLGAGVSVADADRYEKAAGSFTKAKSRDEMVESIRIMKDIAQKYFTQTNDAIDRYQSGRGSAMTVGPSSSGFRVLR